VEIFITKTSDLIKDRQREPKKKPRKNQFDRRRSNLDRRQDGQDGVVVTLSSREEKRQQLDRRQTPDATFKTDLEQISQPSQPNEHSDTPDTSPVRADFIVIV